MAVDISQIEQIVKQHRGLKMEPMSAFYRIEAGGKRVYVARTKKVSRIDMSGFHFTHPAVKVLDDDYRRDHRMGGVEAQIDFSKKEEQVLEAFDTALSFMQALAGEDIDLEPKYRKEVERLQSSPPPPRRRASRGAGTSARQ